MRQTTILALLLAVGTSAVTSQSPASSQGWPSYAADNAATHYSPLTDITPANVAQLAVAWEWYSPDRPSQEFGTQPGNFQNTPLMIDNVLYVSTPYNRVVALDAENGKELWAYDPKAYEDGQPPNGTGFVHRGVAAWRDSSASSGGAQTRSLLSIRWRLIALDAKT